MGEVLGGLRISLEVISRLEWIWSSVHISNYRRVAVSFKLGWMGFMDGIGRSVSQLETHRMPLERNDKRHVNFKACVVTT